MNVKTDFTTPRKLNISHLFFVVAMILIIIAADQFELPNEILRSQKQHLELRAIGDRLLHDANDATSVVPPIQQINEHTLRLRLHQSMAINPDRLADLSIKHLNEEVALHSVIQVLDSQTEAVVYGFEIDHTQALDIPCLGRILPEANYVVEVSFYDPIPLEGNFPSLTFASASLLLTIFGFSFLKEKKPNQNQKDPEMSDGWKLDLALAQIQSKDQRIQLTEKESQIMAILFEHIEQLVTRDHLIEEVWLKHGIVTSRSLDMYISRLRKKLGPLNAFEIVNQHGKGYILKKRTTDQINGQF
ncbi:MAG: winged helix-turn-helix domain-containing protein [Cytophagales bacterium]|nr:winged helix-turn-helix domain-containing protein [Cytophagales bacterium]